MKPRVGLVLSGGGARGAYQVGVLSAVAKILKKHSFDSSPIAIFSGVSAGAINASFLAGHSDDFFAATEKLVDLWSKLESTNVFHSDAMNLGKIGLSWMKELPFGAFTGTTPGLALLDTSPLRDLISSNLDFQRIQKCIDGGHMDALVLTSVDYHTSNSISFIQGREGLPRWNKSRRRAETATISVDHVMASSAIPMLFPPTRVDDRWFGDGCVRNSHPCAPSIYLGAERLLVIGVRRQTLTADDVRALTSDRAPSVGRVVNLLLNAVLLDGIELDVERLARVNEFVRRVPEEFHSKLNYRPINYAMVSPSADIGKIALGKSNRLPRMIRYLLKGLGNLEDASEIISYLLFDPQFCAQLIEIGIEDGMRQEEEIVKLFTA